MDDELVAVCQDTLQRLSAKVDRTKQERKGFNMEAAELKKQAEAFRKSGHDVEAEQVLSQVEAVKAKSAESRRVIACLRYCHRTIRKQLARFEDFMIRQKAAGTTDFV
jgi:uncharacterized membrane protein YqiK